MEPHKDITNNQIEAGDSESIAQLLNEIMTRVSEFLENPGLRQYENIIESKIHTCQRTIAQILDDLVTRVIVSELFPSTRSLTSETISTNISTRTSSFSQNCPVCLSRSPPTATDAQGYDESKIVSTNITTRSSSFAHNLDFPVWPTRKPLPATEVQGDDKSKIISTNVCSISSSFSQNVDCPLCFSKQNLTSTDAQGDEELKIASSTIRSILGEMWDFTLRVRSSIIQQNDELNTVSQIFCMPGTSENTLSMQQVEPPSKVQVCRSLVASCSTMDEVRIMQAPTKKSDKAILPSYSTVISIDPPGPPPPKIRTCESSGSFIPRVPPPSYAEVEGIWEDPPSIISSDSATLGTDPIYIICPRCRTIVVTNIERTRSHMTHIMALILCVFMCWPCAVLPYCIKSCNYTHHTCPNCRYYFGAYRPFY